jgi:hypothetical protein
VPHVIVKRIGREIMQDQPVLKRRSFFIQLLGGIAGGWIAGNLFNRMRHSPVPAKSIDDVRVKINPLAVSRANTDVHSHG